MHPLIWNYYGDILLIVMKIIVIIDSVKNHYRTTLSTSSHGEKSESLHKLDCSHIQKVTIVEQTDLWISSVATSQSSYSR